MNLKINKIIYDLIKWGLTSIISASILIPLYWIFISSIKPSNELFTSPIQYVPTNATFQNYKKLFFELNLGEKALNTLIITTAALVISTIICLTAAYAFSKYKSKGLKIAYGMIVFSALIPGIVTARPLYDFMGKFNLVDTFLGLIILYTSALIPFTILILNNFLNEIPASIYEAAEVDGCKSVQKMFYVTLPLMKPAIATISIINFITCLNDLFTPLFFARKIEVLSVGITTIPKETTYSMPWDLISTMGWIILLPIILFVLLFEKQIMDGIMAGGVKE